MDKAYKKIKPELKQNDLVLVLGAGDVYRLADKLECIDTEYLSTRS